MIYDRLSEYYDQFIDLDLIEQYLQFIQSEKKEGSVMALGCGTAPLAVELAKKDYYVSGSDISSAMLEKAYNNAVENNVHLQLFIHNILDPLIQSYDIVTMTSDVINYLSNEAEVYQSFLNVTNGLNENGIFIFDSLLPAFLNKVSGHKEDILLSDDVLEWSVSKTNIPDQIRHEVKLGQDIEIHYQKTYPLKKIKELLDKAGLYIVRKKKNEERFIFLCKKK